MTDDTNIFTYVKQMGLVTQKLKYLKNSLLYSNFKSTKWTTFPQ